MKFIKILDNEGKLWYIREEMITSIGVDDGIVWIEGDKYSIDLNKEQMAELLRQVGL